MSILSVKYKVQILANYKKELWQSVAPPYVEAEKKYMPCETHEDAMEIVKIYKDDFNVEARAVRVTSEVIGAESREEMLRRVSGSTGLPLDTDI